MKVAAVDIGTNTVRLLLAEVESNAGNARVVAAERHEVITRLGEGLDASGRLGEDPMARALAALAYYGDLIAAAGAERMAGVATSATRSASNGGDFMTRATEVLGFVPRVIDGVEEAQLTFTGATAPLAAGDSFCVIDVGGGSTEFVVGRAAPEYAVSVDIGSVRLTERIASIPLPDAPAMRAHVDELFDAVNPPYPASTVLGSGGTYVTLAKVYHELEGEQIGMVIPLHELQRTVDHLLRLSVTDIAALPGVAPARAAVLQAGAICAERAVAHVGAEQVTISVSDILDGVALSLA